MSPEKAWTPLGKIDPDALKNARRHLHDRVQWLARIARSYRPAVPDDSHTALTWEASDGLFATQSIPVRSGSVRFILDAESVSLGVRSAAGAGDTLDLSRLEFAEANPRVRDFLAGAGIDAAGLRTELPYDHELPAIASLSTGKERVELAKYFDNFFRILRDRFQGEPGAGAARIWPHHFDLATLISIDNTGSEHDRSIGVGFSPGDGVFGQPYVYVTPWPYPETSALGAPPDGMRWHTEGFTALVGTAGELFVGDDSAGRRVSRGVDAAVDICRALLAAPPG